MEIESFMWWFLIQCWEKNDIDAIIQTECNEDHLVEMRFLIKKGIQQYQLSKKAKGLLYSVYGKE